MYSALPLLKLLLVATSLSSVGSAQSDNSVASTATTHASSLLVTTSATAETTHPTTIASNRQDSTPTAVQSSSETASAPLPSSTASVTSSTPSVHLVKAGAGGFVFEPDQLNNVSVGDVVTFEFYPPDHSVARAEFGSACVPYEYTGNSKVGFWSGTQWVNTTNEVSSSTFKRRCRDPA